MVRRSSRSGGSSHPRAKGARPGLARHGRDQGAHAPSFSCGAGTVMCLSLSLPPLLPRVLLASRLSASGMQRDVQTEVDKGWTCAFNLYRRRVRGMRREPAIFPMVVSVSGCSGPSSPAPSLEWSSNTSVRGLDCLTKSWVMIGTFITSESCISGPPTGDPQSFSK